MENNQTMKASELRIGNYLKRDVIVKIDARSIFDIWEETKEYQPIPLTEEWLLRMGFEEIGTISNTEYYTLNNIDIDFNDKGFAQFQYMVGNLSVTKLPYVHQLQNLFYALTNQELEIKES